MSYYGASKTKTDAAIDAMSGGKPVEANRAWYEEEKAKAEKRKKEEDDTAWWENTINRMFGKERK